MYLRVTPTQTMSHDHQTLHFGLSCENESCHTQERVMSRKKISQVTRRNESCHMYKWAMSDAPIHTHTQPPQHNHSSANNDDTPLSLLSHTHPHTHTRTHPHTPERTCPYTPTLKHHTLIIAVRITAILLHTSLSLSHTHTHPHTPQ